MARLWRDLESSRNQWRKREREVRVRPERKRESEVEREKKYISNARVTVTMYICMVTIAVIHCAFMHNFTPTDVSFFVVKMCKMKCFLYFTKLCIY